MLKKTPKNMYIVGIHEYYVRKYTERTPHNGVIVNQSVVWILSAYRNVILGNILKKHYTMV